MQPTRRCLVAAACLLGVALHASAAPAASAAAARDNRLTALFRQDDASAEPQRPAAPTARRNKALNLLGFFPSFLSSGLDYGEDDDDVTFAVNDDNLDDDELSRTIPARRRPQHNNKNTYAGASVNSLQYDNSPIFYIRLPPTPYMFVPGLGYVSQPPSLGMPVAPPQVEPFINVPVDFVSNGKPTNVYEWAGPPAPPYPAGPYGYGAPPAPPPAYRPQPPAYKPPRKPPTGSKVTNLKGPYVFNGKPSDSVFVLRDSYNSLYSDALQNFYP